jgi:VanZ family protein
MSLSAKGFLRYQLPAVLWAMVIFTLSSLPSHRLPIIPLSISDKIGHFVVFFIFGLFLYRALTPLGAISGTRWTRGKKLALALIIAVAYGAFDELYQGTVPGRTVDLADLLADTIGASAAVAWIAFRSKPVQAGSALE